MDALSSLVVFLLQACMSPHRGVSPHGGQHPPGPLDTTPSMSDRLFRLGLAESQVRKKCSDVHFKTVSHICISILMSFCCSRCFHCLVEAIPTSQVKKGTNLF